MLIGIPIVLLYLVPSSLAEICVCVMSFLLVDGEGGGGGEGSDPSGVSYKLQE